MKSKDWTDFFYSKQSKASACLPWIHRRLTHYCTVNLGKNDTNDQIPTFMNEVNMFDLRTAKGEPVVNYEYEFDVAPLQDKYSLPLPENYTIYPGMRNCSFQKVTTDENDLMTQENIASLRSHHSLAGNHLKYHHKIEKKDYVTYGTTPVSNTLCQLDLYVGVIPPLASSPFDATAKFQEVMAYWQVDATLVVDFNMYSAGVGAPYHKVSKNIYMSDSMDPNVRNANSKHCFIDGHLGFENK